MAMMAVPAGVRSGFVVGTMEAMTPGDWFGIFNDAFFGDFFNDANTLAQGITEDASDFEAFVLSAFKVAEAAFFDAHFD